MIQAKKSKLFTYFFSLYNRWLIHFSFETIYIKIERPLPQQAVFIANHSSWWDGLLLHQINYDELKHDLFVMMHESGLQRYPFFRKLGAFSVNRLHPKSVMTSLKYGCTLLEEGKSLWIFPQGDEQALEKRPLDFQAGFMYFVEKNEHVPIIPVVYYYAFRHSRKPDCFIHVGSPIFLNELTGQNRKERTLQIEQVITNQLNELRQAVISGQFVGFTRFFGDGQ